MKMMLPDVIAANLKYARGLVLNRNPTNVVMSEIIFSSNLKTHITQSALEFCPIHCPNGRLGQDLGFGGFAFALKFPELLNRNSAAARAKLGQTSCFPNGAQIWCPIGQYIGFPAGANEHNQALP